MATVLDLGLLNYLLPIFVWAFVFVILFALFEKFNIFGERTPLHALISFIFATLFILVKDLRDIITIFTPYLVILFILITVILMAVMLLGIKHDDIVGYLLNNSFVTITVIVAVVVLFFAAAIQVSPDFIGYPEDGEDSSLNKYRRIIFHPQVLGIVFLLVMFAFIVRSVGFKG